MSEEALSRKPAEGRLPEELQGRAGDGPPGRGASADVDPDVAIPFDAALVADVLAGDPEEPPVEADEEPAAP